jgi:hypothetical protein
VLVTLVVRTTDPEGSTLAHIDREATSARVDAQLEVWRQVLTEALDQPAKHGRQLLREVLTGPLVFTPEGPEYRFRAPSGVGDLIAGAVAHADRMQSVKAMRGVGRAHKLASPGGSAALGASAAPTSWRPQREPRFCTASGWMARPGGRRSHRRREARGLPRILGFSAEFLNFMSVIEGVASQSV